MNRTLAALLWCLATCSSRQSSAAWPAYRHDIERSRVSDEKLVLPLHRTWTDNSLKPPRPAWPPQAKLLNRTDFDYTSELVVADGLLVFGSSADDTIRARDAASGAERWQFVTGGPVRLPPQLLGGRVFAAADDGCVYCLDAQTGALVWQRRLAPGPELMIGNGRLISRWPCRCGVLVDGDRVYAVAGLWPNDGIYIYALDAANGETIWLNDTSGFFRQGFHDSPTGNHQGEFAFVGITPQGPMALSQGILFIPQGQCNPLRLDSNTGQPPQEVPEPDGKGSFKPVGNGFPGAGGEVIIDGDFYHVLAMHRNRAIYLNRFDIHSRWGGGWRHSDRRIPQIAKGGLFRTVAPGGLSVTVRSGQILGYAAYDLALTDELAVVGEADRVRVLNLADNSELWQASVNGNVHSIAIADGRLYVATDTGQITCFGESSANAVREPAPTTTEAGADVQQLLDAVVAGQTRDGYALILGDAGGLAQALAAQTRLHVVQLLPDQDTVRQRRQALVTEVPDYGTRRHLLASPAAERLPLPPYFANLVIVGEHYGALAPTELYRVLRPCGGLLLASKALLVASGAPPESIVELAGLPAVLRPPLAAANDWRNRVPDPLVRWPMQPLWFGGPAPAELASYRSGEELVSAPVAANGRYFVQGETSMSAVDAYNGTVLWTRPMPHMWSDIRELGGRLHMTQVLRPPATVAPEHWRVRLMRRLGGDDDHAYVWLGRAFFREQGQGFIELDARTGQQLSVYSPYSSPRRFRLDQKLTWRLDPARQPAGKKSHPMTLNDDDDELTMDLVLDPLMFGIETVADTRTSALPAGQGELQLSLAADAIVIELSTRDEQITDSDGWDLFFDLRPYDQRWGLYGQATFGVRVTPAGRVEALAGAMPDGLTAVGSRRDTGCAATIRLPLQLAAQLAGGELESFGFAATMYAAEPNDDAAKPVLARHLFADDRAFGVNNGWANFYLPQAAMPAEPAPPAVILGTAPDRNWGQPGALATNGLAEETASGPRIHPLTGELGPRIYRSGTFGCGGATYSATSVFRRPSKQAIGVYDFDDDSGMHFLCGLSAPCGTSSIAALGLLIFSDSRFRCDCNPPLKTSAAFVHSEHRYNEDWALFYERDVDTRVRQAQLNLGAFGDRRDALGKLWLALPRVSDRGLGYGLVPGQRVVQRLPGVWLQHTPASIRIPATLDIEPNGETYRTNADRQEIADTDRPWIYASGISGLRAVELQLDFLRPIAAAAATGVVVDGRLDEAAWAGDAERVLPNTEAAVRFRHDDANLYVAVSRAAVTDRKGNLVKWRQRISDADGEVWRDDSVEVFLSNASSETVVHLAVSASGARFDALCRGPSDQDLTWNGSWRSAVLASAAGLTCELAVPLADLLAAGIEISGLDVNVQVNQQDLSAEAAANIGAEGVNWNQPGAGEEAFCFLGAEGRKYCRNFVPLGFDEAPAIAPRAFTVTLHFAELEALEAGGRVFDVMVQDKLVLDDFDIAATAGVRHAVARTFEHVQATDTLRVALVPVAGQPPILSALELRDEGWLVQAGVDK